jgi:protein-tyrosine phosphatase
VFQPKTTVPFPNSYWVVPSQILAGEHPIDIGEEATRKRLASLLDAGVRIIVDLTEEREQIPEYKALLHTLATDRQIDVKIHRHPIPDRGIPSVETLRSILDVIDHSVAKQSPVYVHCFAGIGRTGTIVGCYLRRHRVANAQDVIARISELRSQMPYGDYPSPQTPEQLAVIRCWQEGP